MDSRAWRTIKQGQTLLRDLGLREMMPEAQFTGKDCVHQKREELHSVRTAKPAWSVNSFAESFCETRFLSSRKGFEGLNYHGKSVKSESSLERREEQSREREVCLGYSKANGKRFVLSPSS